MGHKLKINLSQRYIRLFKDILILGLGQFASKILSYVMLPFYTDVLSQADYGTADLVTNTANLLIPLVSLCVADAVVRFAMESKESRGDALTAGFCTVGIGYIVFLLLMPAILKISLISDYVWILYIYVLCSLVNSISGLFARCIGYMSLYAVSGFLNTLSVVVLNLIFLKGFQWGITGYLLSIVLSDLFAAIFVFTVGSLHRYLKPIREIRKSVWKAMIRFSAPLIPNSLSWWVVNLSDSYIIGYVLADGKAINGLYRVAYKIPALVTMVSTVFLQAWQLSAIANYNEEDRTKFYNQVLKVLQMMVFCAAAVLMLLVRPIMSVMVSDEFYEAWRYVPFLLAASGFTCLVNFYATIYVAAKRSVFSMITSVTGAVTNLVLNLILIPRWGAQGAAFATMISYVVVYVVRGLDCGKRFGVWVPPFWILINSLLMFWQATMMVLNLKSSLTIEIILCAVMLIYNLPKLIRCIKPMLSLRTTLRSGKQQG